MSLPAYLQAIQSAISGGYKIDLDAGLVVGPSGNLLTPSKTGKQKYPTVSLYPKGMPKKAYTVPVHKIVAYGIWGLDAFKPGIVVRHLDGNPLNNRKSNLALGTQSQNEMDKAADVRKRVAMQAVAARDPNAPRKLRKRKLTPEMIRDIRSRVVFKNGRAAYGFVKRMARRYGVSKATISSLLRDTRYDPCPPP